MAKLFSAREICTLAMRLAGVVAPQDTAAAESNTLVALSYLDLILGEKSGTTRLWFLVPVDLTFTYTADADSVDISALLGSNNRIDMLRAAYNADTDDEIALLRREDFDKIRNGGTFPFAPGRKLYVASDGDDTYTAYMRPVPTEALSVRVTGNKLSTTVTAATGSSSNLAHGFETAWQRWMIYALAADIGNGPLARLPTDRVETFLGIAETSWVKLNRYRGGGQRKAARFTRAWAG